MTQTSRSQALRLGVRRHPQARQVARRLAARLSLQRSRMPRAPRSMVPHCVAALLAGACASRVVSSKRGASASPAASTGAAAEIQPTLTDMRTAPTATSPARIARLVVLARGDEPFIAALTIVRAPRSPSAGPTLRQSTSTSSKEAAPSPSMARSRSAGLARPPSRPPERSPASPTETLPSPPSKSSHPPIPPQNMIPGRGSGGNPPAAAHREDSTAHHPRDPTAAP